MDIEKLEKLNELREKGILTKEEFEEQKKELLSDNRPSQHISKKNNSEGLSLWGYFVECLTNKFCCFEGRARRKEYWAFTLFYTLLDLILSMLVILIAGDELSVNIAKLILSLVLLLPSLGVLVRRLHDVNFSGWWILTFIVPLVLIFFKSDMKENKYGCVPEGVIK